MILAALIAAILWVPYLFAEVQQRAAWINAGIASAPGVVVSAGDLMKEVKRRILYQGISRKARIAFGNVHAEFSIGLCTGVGSGRGAGVGVVVLISDTGGLWVVRGGIDLSGGAREVENLGGAPGLRLVMTLGPVILLGNVVFRAMSWRGSRRF